MKEQLKPGDRLIILNMVGENDVPLGSKGTVKRIYNDPFQPGSSIIEMNWDNGSTLSILSDVDDYKIISKN
jgi:hypothetical protein